MEMQIFNLQPTIFNLPYRQTTRLLRAAHPPRDRGSSGCCMFRSANGPDRSPGSDGYKRAALVSWSGRTAACRWGNAWHAKFSDYVPEFDLLLLPEDFSLLDLLFFDLSLSDVFLLELSFSAPFLYDSLR